MAAPAPYSVPYLWLVPSSEALPRSVLVLWLKRSEQLLFGGWGSVQLGSFCTVCGSPVRFVQQELVPYPMYWGVLWATVPSVGVLLLSW